MNCSYSHAVTGKLLSTIVFEELAKGLLVSNLWGYTVG